MLERHHTVGGAAITETFFENEDGKFRNSAAAYTVSLLQPKIIKDMDLQRHGLRVVLRTLDNYLPLPDGYLLAGRGGLTAREIARHSAKDAQALPAYETALGHAADFLRSLLLTPPPNAGGGIGDMIRLAVQARRASQLPIEDQRDLLGFFTKSAGEILDEYFESPAVKALFGFDAIVGHFASPYEPGSAYVLLHHVFGEAAGVSGAWGHAIGGMGAITQAMAHACTEAGVTIKTSAAVSQITTDKGRVSGVIAGQDSFAARSIAGAIHPQTLIGLLDDPSLLDKDFARRIDNYKSHSGTFRMNVALSGLPNFTQAPKGNDYLSSGIIIAPSLEYMDAAWIDARAQGMASAPIVEMLIPSVLDDSLAPQGRHVASLFCQHFDYDIVGGWTEKAERRAAQVIINTVERHAPGFKTLILGEQLYSPAGLERRFGLVRGDIFHGRMSLDQLYSARPALGAGAYRMPIRGLFLAGSGAHPGGGVTGAPGHNAAQVIFKNKR